MNAQAIVRDARQRLKEQADPGRAEGERRYFKNTIRNYGVTVPRSQAIAKELFREHKDELSEGDWLALAEALLATGWFEEGTVGLALAGHARPAPSDALFATYARWLETHAGNWAHCDDLCGGLIGPLLVERPSLARRLRPWTKSKNPQGRCREPDDASATRPLPEGSAGHRRGAGGR